MYFISSGYCKGALRTVLDLQPRDEASINSSYSYRNLVSHGRHEQEGIPSVREPDGRMKARKGPAGRPMLAKPADGRMSPVTKGQDQGSVPAKQQFGFEVPNSTSPAHGKPGEDQNKHSTNALVSQGPEKTAPVSFVAYTHPSGLHRVTARFIKAGFERSWTWSW